MVSTEQAQVDGLWWLASPSDYDSGRVYYVNGNLGYFSTNLVSNSRAVRPLVCIPTSVFQEKYEATLESNYLGEAINVEKYGQKVTNYTSQDTAAQEEAGAWRLFYQNKYYTYLISDNLVPTGDTLQNLYTSAGWGEKTGADVSKIGQVLNRMLKDAGGFTSSNTNRNIKAVGYLTDPTQWSKYANADVEFAIASPSIELYAKSFNETSKKANRGVTIEVSADSTKYIYPTNERILQVEYNHGIYRHKIYEHEDQNAWWLVSPLNVGNVCNVDDNMGCLYEFGSIPEAHRCLRPMVCIKTSVFQNKYESTLVDE